MTSYLVPDRGIEGYRDLSFSSLVRAPHSHRARSANTQYGSIPNAFVVASDADPKALALAEQMPGGFITSGANDEVEFAAALTEAAGGRLLVSDGTFNFAGEITPPAGARLVGMGPEATRIVSTAGTGLYVFKNTATSAMTIEGMTIEHSTGRGVLLDGLTGVLERAVLRNIVFDGIGEHAVYMNNVLDSLIAFCVFNDIGAATANTYDCIHILGNSDRNQILANQVVAHANIRYGLNMNASTVDKTRLNTNTFGDPTVYGTAMLNDAGTDTVYEQAKEVLFPLSGVLAVGSDPFKVPTSQDIWIIDVQPTVDVSPVGSDLVFDVNLNGTSIYPTSTKPTVTDGDADGVGPLAPPDTNFAAKGSRIQVDIDAVGSTTPGTDALLKLRYIYV